MVQCNQEQMSQTLWPGTSSALMPIESLSSIPEVMPVEKAPVQCLSVEATMYSQVCTIISVYGRSIDDISVIFFNGVHRWLPVISTQRFYDRMKNLRGPPPVDFSILLLTLCLLTSNPSQSRARGHDQKTLYLTTKMLFAYAQAAVAPSLSLVQASLLITNYEHSQGLGSAAYVSIGTCVRLAHAAGLSNDILSRDIDLWDGEKCNVWWAILSCERFIAREMQCSKNPLLTELPTPDKLLPLELDTLELSTRPLEETNRATLQSIFPLNSSAVFNFGREAQASYLADMVRKAICAEDSPSKAIELGQIDDLLQKFLANVMQQSTTGFGPFCGAIVLIIRRVLLESIDFSSLFQGHEPLVILNSIFRTRPPNLLL